MKEHNNDNYTCKIIFTKQLQGICESKANGRGAISRHSDYPDLDIDDEVCECEEDLEWDLSYIECDRDICERLEERQLHRSLKPLICKCRKPQKHDTEPSESESSSSSESSESDSDETSIEISDYDTSEDTSSDSSSSSSESESCSSGKYCFGFNEWTKNTGINS